MTTSRTFPSRLVIAIATLGAVFAFAASARATVYCVDYSSCPAGGVTKDTIGDAVTAANVSSDHDTVRIGPGMYIAPGSASQPVDLIGSGVGTTVVQASGASSSGIYLNHADSTVSDLTVRLTADHEVGIRLNHAAGASRVAVTADTGLTGTDGILTEAQGSNIDHATIDLPYEPAGQGIADIGGGGLIANVDVTAGTGIGGSSSALTTIRGAVIRAAIPVHVYGGSTDIANALLLPNPDPSASSFEAMLVKNGNGHDGQLSAGDVTVVGKGNSGFGLLVQSVSGGSASANLSGVLIRDVGETIDRSGFSPANPANVSLDHSSFQASKISDGAGNGAVTQGAGNLTGDPDPKFVNPAAGDYRLSATSPLIDKGSIDVFLTPDDPDLAGNPRIVDGDGNGNAQRDIGAFEFQPAPPAVPGAGSGGGGSTSAAAAGAAGAAHGIAAPVLGKLKKIGTTFRFKLDQPAKVRFLFTLKGKRKGAIVFNAHAGANKVRFVGRISKKRKLRPGRYKLTATAINSAGERSKPRSLRFKLVRR